MTASCRVCGRQVEVSDSGTPMPCLCIKRPLDVFLADAAHDCIGAYAAGVRDEADDIEKGTGYQMDKVECPYCGQLTRCLKTHRCPGE